MKKAVLALFILCFACLAFGGFKPKSIKSKKPEKFQVHTTVSGVTYAADLLLKEKDQEKYFYDALTPSNIIAVRLAVFNKGKEEVVLPMDDLRLISPDGVEFVRVDPESVAQAVLGEAPPLNVEEGGLGLPQVGVHVGGPTDPRYDPNDPRYDPNDPRYDPNDPRYPGSYPPGSSPSGRYPSSGTTGRPGVIFNPGGTGEDESTGNEKKLVAVDFQNKAHTSDPIIRTLSRDRFLYFSIPDSSVFQKEFMLILPVSKGIPREIVLRFQ